MDYEYPEFWRDLNYIFSSFQAMTYNLLSISLLLWTECFVLPPLPPNSHAEGLTLSLTVFGVRAYWEELT